MSFIWANWINSGWKFTLSKWDFPITDFAYEILWKCKLADKENPALDFHKQEQFTNIWSIFKKVYLHSM